VGTILICNFYKTINLIPSATHFDYIDRFVKVTDEDSAHSARRVTRMEGMFVGYTSGAAMQAVDQLVNENFFNKESTVVIIFPDHGSRYMSKIYSEDWMEKQGFFDSDHESQKQIEYVNELNEKK
jgi:cystathionine beta-synthase